MRTALRTGGIVAFLLAGIGALFLGARALQPREPQARISLRDRVVVVTGGSRGLGFDIARRLVDEGAKVVLFDRDAEELSEAVVRLAPRGEVMGIPCDVAHEPTVRSAIRRVVERYGHLDGVVNAAGLIAVGATESLTRAGWHDALATSFWGPLHLLDAALPYLRRSSAAFIVRIGRAAVDALAEDLHDGLTAEGIRVIEVDPGYAPPVEAPSRPTHAWFDVAERFPVLPVPIDEASRRIVDALHHGRTSVTLGSGRGMGVIRGIRQFVQPVFA